jgi:pyruvate/2-oxoglutarate dehydrogenase complex dihydrolipoamide dehydrogenase (E3) component
MAQIFHMLGTEITVLEALPDILRSVDRPLTRRLEKLLVGDGIAAESEGMLRIVCRHDNGVIVGVHILVEGAADLMNEASLAVRTGLRLEDLMKSIHPHPTLAESFGFAARASAPSAR